MKISKIAFSVICLLLFVQGISAQEKFRVQAMFIYNFTRMTVWPQGYQNGDFVIAVYGNSQVYRELSDLAASRQVGNQKIVVKQYQNLEDIDKCHILFVAPNQSRSLSEITQKLKSDKSSTLVISESRNALQSGAAINFITENERPRYELHETNARSMGLTLGQEMSRLASNVIL